MRLVQSAADGARSRHPVRLPLRRSRSEAVGDPLSGALGDGLFVPLVRELRTTRYEFVLPFVVDSSLTERTFGLAPTDLDVALRAVSRSG